MEIKIRLITCPSELLWVNTQYKKIDFVASEWGTDRVALAFINKKHVGVGRLVPLENGDYELGGIFVLPEFRNLSIAKNIVSFLVENASLVKRMYCLPFEYLKGFYESFGFRISRQVHKAPSDVRKKYEWCLENYSQNVLFMVRDENCE